MAKIYAALIRKGIKTLDEVPARLRSTVKALLAGGGSRCLKPGPARGTAPGS